MGSLNFISTGFVIGGVLAATIPLWIHLLLKQRAREVPIGSVRFLKLVLQDYTRRRRLRQWILLALRILAVLLLAALFARPWLDRSMLAGFNREVVVLIDQSASLQIDRGDGTSLLEQVRAIARDELDRLDDSTAIHVAEFADEVRVMKPEELDHPPMPTLAATDYGHALGWARDTLLQSSRPVRQVILITDLQQSGIDRTSVNRFPPDVELIVRDVGRGMVQNVSLIDCRATVTEIRPGEPVQVIARIRNTDALPVNDLPVTLRLDGPGGAIMESQTLRLAGAETVDVTWQLPMIDLDGVYAGSVSFDHADDLPTDNCRWLAFEARHPDRLLLIDGEQGSSVFTNETYYLETALQLRLPGLDPSQRSYEIERIVWDDGEGFPSLDGFRAIVLANVGRLTAVDADRLREFVDAGGSLLVFCGDRTRPDHLAHLREAGLLTAEASSVPLSGRLRMRTWEREHPVFRPFLDPQAGDLRQLVFHRMVQLQNLGPDVRILAAVEEAPLLVEQTRGSGRTLLMATAVDREWSDWPQQRLFVPMIHSFAAWLTGQTSRQPVVETHTTGLRGEVHSDSSKPTTGRSASDRTDPHPEARTGGIVTHDATTHVFNMDAAESSLDRTTEQTFRQTYGLSERDRATVIAELSDSVPAPDGAEQANEIWTTVLWLLLAVLTVELLLATRIHA